MDAYHRQLQLFRRKFGREMRPEDPFFFDPDEATPQFRDPADAHIALTLLMELMAEAGVDPEAIYAFKITGGLLPAGDAAFTAEQDAAWKAAVEEYREKLARTKTQ